jgi:hypothetical protein
VTVQAAADNSGIMWGLIGGSIGLLVGAIIFFRRRKKQSEMGTQTATADTSTSQRNTSFFGRAMMLLSPRGRVLTPSANRRRAPSPTGSDAGTVDTNLDSDFGLERAADVDPSQTLEDAAHRVSAWLDESGMGSPVAAEPATSGFKLGSDSFSEAPDNSDPYTRTREPGQFEADPDTTSLSVVLQRIKSGLRHSLSVSGGSAADSGSERSFVSPTVGQAIKFFSGSWTGGSAQSGPKGAAAAASSPDVDTKDPGKVSQLRQKWTPQRPPRGGLAVDVGGGRTVRSTPNPSHDPTPP